MHGTNFISTNSCPILTLCLIENVDVHLSNGMINCQPLQNIISHCIMYGLRRPNCYHGKMLGSTSFHILWTFKSVFSPCPYGIVVVVFHFDSGGRKTKQSKSKLILLNKHVSLRLRLKLFHATVFPTAVFGLVSPPLTQKHLHKLDVVQRRMLRSVGWIRIPDEPWDTTMRRRNQRMEYAASLHPLQSWSNQYFINEYRLASKIASNQSA